MRSGRRATSTWWAAWLFALFVFTIPALKREPSNRIRREDHTATRRTKTTLPVDLLLMEPEGVHSADGPTTRSGRQVRHTERMQDYIKEQSHDNYQRMYERLCRHIDTIDIPSKQGLDHRTELKRHYRKFVNDFDLYLQAEEEFHSLLSKEENTHHYGEHAERLRKLQDWKAQAESYLTGERQVEDSAREHAPSLNVSNHSGHSARSTASQRQEIEARKAELEARAAGLANQHRLERERTLIMAALKEEERAVEARKVKLVEQMQASRINFQHKQEELRLQTELDECNARNDVLERWSARGEDSVTSLKQLPMLDPLRDIKQGDGPKRTSTPGYGETRLRTPQLVLGAEHNSDAPDSLSTVEWPISSAPPTRTGIKDSRTPTEDKTTPHSAVDRDPLTRLADILAHRQDDLPPQEPDVFKGNIYDFPAWISSFKVLVESRKSSASDRLYYLGKYTEGEAKNAIKGLLILGTNEAYTDAMCTLETRYGDKLVVAKTYRTKIAKWSQVKHGDGKELQNLADFLRHCKTAMATIEYLQVLNDPEEQGKIIKKLPPSIANRWVRRVDNEINVRKGGHPSFSSLCDFLDQEARIACSPVNPSFDLDKTEEAKRDTRKDRHRSARTLATASDEPKPPTHSEHHKGETSFTRKQAPSATSSQAATTCAMCSGKHQLDKCPEFIKLSLQERERVLLVRGLCFACLKFGHTSKDCKSRKICDVCNKPHPTVMHNYNFKLRSPLVKNGSVRTLEKAVSNRVSIRDDGQQEGCAHNLILPVHIYHKQDCEHKVLVYALLDPQSDSCFISDTLLDRLGAKGVEVHLGLRTMLADSVIDCRKVNGLCITDYNHELEVQLPSVYSRDTIPASHAQIPKPETISKWPHLATVATKLHPFMRDVEIGLLIGMNCPRVLKPRDVIPGADNDPYAVKTDLGWGVIGMMAPLEYATASERKCHFAYRTQAKEISPLQVAQMIDMEFQERRSPDKLSMEDTRFLNLMNASIHQRDDGHMEMPLPFKEPNIAMPNNRMMAEKRLSKLKRKLQNDTKYREHYVTFMKDLVAKGHAEKAPSPEGNEESGRIWYVPHHGVYHPKKRNKIRVVFDCSAQYGDDALNKHLLKGPDLINNLTGVLCRFRQEVVAFTCDIEGMFHQVGVNASDRDYLRFLWWEDGNFDQPPTDYRMTVHLFGATSSPGCANLALKTIANRCEEEFGKPVADFIRNDFYVDDGLKSVATPATALELIKDSKALCARGGFNLHKYKSNSSEVMRGIPATQGTNDIRDIDLHHRALPIERTLGVQWCMESDCFQFRVELMDKPLTRRGILSTIGSIFDPLGLVAPFLLRGKQILQEICRDGVDWDAPVSDDTRAKWEHWRSELNLLSRLKIPRCYRSNNLGSPRRIELHHFADASQTGYGQCSYLRLIDDKDTVSCTLVMGKAKVTPTKAVTIPRLELMAAVVSVNVSEFLERELQYENISHTFWTDSNVVLGYISNDAKRFHIFVANRIQQIRDATAPSQWRHVDTKQNPADVASRGAGAKELMESTLWWKGPPFLSTANPIPAVAELHDLDLEDPEVRKATVLTARIRNETSMDILARFKYFSSWLRLKKAVAVCLRFKQRLRDRSLRFLPVPLSQKLPAMKERLLTYTPVNVEEVQNAGQVIIKVAQAHAFPGEIQVLRLLRSRKDGQNDNTKERTQTTKRESALYRLDPFLDEADLLRVGGRISRASLPVDLTHPVILPRHGYITKLVIDHHHVKNCHSGRGMTLNELRGAGYWIVTGRAAVTSHILNCVTCRKLRGAPQGQKMADLPHDRLQETAPFTYSAVDYFGPFFVRERRSELKRWGVMFTCLSSRAIHIETANALTTDAFLNAYRRFVGRRGAVRELRCDQGTNFIGGKRALEAALVEMDDGKIRQELLKDNCDWVIFNPNVPHASHMGGVWERMIRSARTALSGILESHWQQLDDELLRTLLVEAEAIVNSRPLTCPDMTSPDSQEPLTPSHILTMKPNVLMPPPGIFQREDLYCRQRWRRVQYLANQFWIRWRKEFLPTLQERRKWLKPQRNLEEGDIVILIDEALPRNKWPRARVVQTYPTVNDQLVRKVRISTGTAEYDRPVHKLMLLLRGDEDLK